MLARLALVLMLALAALPARADMEWLDDPAMTPGDSTDRLMLEATGVSSTQTSIQFVAKHASSGIFELNVTTCTACNMALRIETKDHDGTWYNWCATGTAIVATGKVRFAVGTADGGTSSSNLTAACLRRLPPIFRASVFWNSGTNATYTISGVTW